MRIVRAIAGDIRLRCNAAGAREIKTGFVCLAAALGLASPSLAQTMREGESPTQEQLLRGRELLQRVMSVAAKVPLFDAEAVLGEFGFRQIWIASFPRYVRIYPKGKDANALPSELKGTGFVSISVDPWRSPDLYSRQIATLTASFDFETACVSIADANARLGLPLQTYPIVDAHPVERPPRQHTVGIAQYAAPKIPVGGIDAFVAITFDYQTCARSMSLGYLLRTEEGKK